MEVFSSKNKWDSQYIQKKFKNKHSNGMYAGWTADYSNKNHFVSLKKLCNEYTKNDRSQQRQDRNRRHYMPSKSPTYWRCSACTYNNLEGDSHCSICGSSFQPSSTAKLSNTHTCTLSDYFPSELNDILHRKDDLDESIQIAIISSFGYSSTETCTNEEYTHDDDDTDFETISIDLTASKPALNGYKNVKTSNCKHADNEHRATTKKLWCFEKRMEMKQRSQDRKSAKKKHTKNNSRHAGHRKVRRFLRRTKMAGVQDSIRSQYDMDASFDLHNILNPKILTKFCKHGGTNGSELNIVYHGTDSRNNQSIIANGLIVGGTKGVRIRCGRAYGTGVYCSPFASTARCYEAGSMFVCVVKYKKVNNFGNIWVVPDDRDILPIYLASFPSAKASTSNGTGGATPIVKPKLDGLNQQIIKFIPCFMLLNQRECAKRKIQRKWNAYFKIKHL